MTEAQIYAWIFLSVPEQPGSLKDISFMADAINHAVPTQKELQSSFGWLLAQDLIRKEEGKYSQTETGVALRKKATQGTVMQTWKAVTSRFAQIIDEKHA